MSEAYGPKDCGLCPRILDAHCRLHGGQFCDLLARYRTDPHYGSDDVLYDLTQIATPEQMGQVTAELQRQDRAAPAPPPARPTA